MGQISESRDTTDEARHVQTEMFRAMTPAERLLIAVELSEAVERLARAGIERDHPGATERQVLWHLAARRYGEALADAAFGTSTPG